MTSHELYQTAYTNHYDNHKYDDALKGYQEVIKLFPDSEEAYYAKQQIPIVKIELTMLSYEMGLTQPSGAESRAKQDELIARLEQELHERDHRPNISANQVARLKQSGADRYYEYNVVKLCDTTARCIDTYELMSTLNQLGIEGWRLVSCFTNELGINAHSSPGYGRKTAASNEHILIFERFHKFL